MASSGHKAGKVKGAELHVGNGDIKRSKFGSENLGKSRKGRADSRLGGMEGRVNGRDDGRRKHKDLGRDPFLPDGVQARGEEGQEGLDCEDRLEEVGVEEIGEAGRGDSGDGRSLVVEAWDENDRLQSELVGLHSGSRGLRGLEEEGKMFDGSAGIGWLGSMSAYCVNIRISKLTSVVSIVKGRMSGLFRERTMPSSSAALQTM